MDNAEVIGMKIKALHSEPGWINPEPGHSPRCVADTVLQPGVTCGVELAEDQGRP